MSAPETIATPHQFVGLSWVHINDHNTLEDGMPSETSVGRWELRNHTGALVGVAWPRIGRWMATPGNPDNHPFQTFETKQDAFRFLVSLTGVTE